MSDIFDQVASQGQSQGDVFDKVEASSEGDIFDKVSQEDAPRPNAYLRTMDRVSDASKYVGDRLIPGAEGAIGGRIASLANLGLDAYKRVLQAAEELPGASELFGAPSPVPPNESPASYVEGLQGRLQQWRENQESKDQAQVENQNQGSGFWERQAGALLHGLGGLAAVPIDVVVGGGSFPLGMAISGVGRYGINPQGAQEGLTQFLAGKAMYEMGKVGSDLPILSRLGVQVPGQAAVGGSIDTAEKLANEGRLPTAQETGEAALQMAPFGLLSATDSGALIKRRRERAALSEAGAGERSPGDIFDTISPDLSRADPARFNFWDRINGTAFDGSSPGNRMTAEQLAAKANSNSALQAFLQTYSDLVSAGHIDIAGKLSISSLDQGNHVPGSKHPLGLALDFHQSRLTPEERNTFYTFAAQNGLSANVKGEPWHLSYVGPGAEATQVVTASKPTDMLRATPAERQPAGDVPDFIVQAANQFGVDPGYLYQTMMAESGGRNISARRNGEDVASAKGLFQITDGTWQDLTANPELQALGVTPDRRNDPQAQAYAAALLTRDNANALRQALGRDPSPGDIYMSAFLGRQGGADFLTGLAQNPNDAAINHVSAGAVRANHSIFYDSTGRARTNAEVYDLMAGKVQGGNQPVATALQGLGGQPLRPELAALRQDMESRGAEQVAPGAAPNTPDATATMDLLNGNLGLGNPLGRQAELDSLRRDIMGRDVSSRAADEMGAPVPAVAAERLGALQALPPGGQDFAILSDAHQQAGMDAQTARDAFARAKTDAERTQARQAYQDALNAQEQARQTALADAARQGSIPRVKPQETLPQQRPITPTPTHEGPVVPEPRAYINAQVQAMADPRSEKKAVLITPGTPFPSELPKGTHAFVTEHGTVLTTDPRLRDRLPYNATDAQMGDAVLNYAGGRPLDPRKGVVIRALDEKGVPVGEVHVDKADKAQAMAAVKGLSPVNKAVMVPLRQALADRVKGLEKEGALQGQAGRDILLSKGRRVVQKISSANPVNAFVESPRGDVDFGAIPKEVADAFGGKSAPIRLLNGDLKSGGVHIEKRHGEEIRGQGFDGVASFVNHITNDYDAVFKGKGRSIFLTVRGEKPWHYATVKMEYDPEGDFWKVQSASPSRSEFFISDKGRQKKELLWERAQTNHFRKEAPSAVSGQSNSLADIAATKKIIGLSEKGNPVTRQSLQDALADTPFRGAIVLDSPAELPDRGLRDYMERTGNLGAKGVYDIQTGKAYVFAKNHADMADAMVTARDEMFHRGIFRWAEERAKTNPKAGTAFKQLNAFMNTVRQAKRTAVNAWLEKNGYGELKDTNYGSNEWLTHAASYEAPRWYDRYVAAVLKYAREFGKAVGFDFKLTDAEIRDWGRRVEEGMGEDARVMVGRAKIEPLGALFRKFDDAEQERRWQEGQKGIGGKPGLIDRAKAKVEQIKNGFTRHFINIPNTEHFARAHEWFRQLESAPEFAQETAIRSLEKITKGLTPAEFDVFQRKVVLDDFSHGASEGVTEFPFGMTATDVARENLKYANMVMTMPKVAEALKTRREAMDTIGADLVRYGILRAEQLKNPAYFRHEVLKYARDYNQTVGTGKEIRKPKPGYSKQRTWSNEDISSNYLEVDGAFMMRAGMDIATAKMIEKVKKSDYNIKDQLVAQAKAENEKWLRAAGINPAGLKPAEIRQAMGHGFKTWRDFIPDTHTTWQADKGLLYHSGTTLSDHVAMDALDAMSDPDYLNVAPNVLSDVVDGMRKALMVSGRKPEMVLPTEMVKTLQQFKDPKRDTLLQAAAAIPLGKWKQWVLMNPRRVLKYNLNNMSGDLDAVIAGNIHSLKKIGPAVQELWQVMKGKAEPSQRYLEAVELGVFNSGFSIQEIPEIKSLDPFQKLLSDKKGFSGGKAALIKMWRASKDYTQFRENWLRYAAYLDYAERLEAGESMDSIGYGAAHKALVDGLADNKDKAAVLARSLVGDYGSISHYGQDIRRTIIPFYSWMEVNTARYSRLFRNAFAQSINQGLKTGGITGLAVGAKTATWLGIRYAMVNGLIYAWNNMMFPDEEKELPKEDQAQLHVLLGRDADGNIRSLRLQGALSDFLSWVGYNDVVSLGRDIASGNVKLKDVAKAPVNRVVSGLTPIFKTPLEMITGNRYFPDVFRPRPIDDRWREFARMFSVENEYDALMGNPSRGYLNTWAGSITYNRNPGEMAYNETRSLIRAFKESKGEESSGFSTSPKAEAAKDYKLAIRYGDADAEKKAKAKMAKLGMGKDEMDKLLLRAAPLTSLPLKERKEFLASLDERDKKQVEKADKWYRETFLTERQEAKYDIQQAKQSRSQILDDYKQAIMDGDRAKADEIRHSAVQEYNQRIRESNLPVQLIKGSTLRQARHSLRGKPTKMARHAELYLNQFDDGEDDE